MTLVAEVGEDVAREAAEVVVALAAGIPADAVVVVVAVAAAVAVVAATGRIADFRLTIDYCRVTEDLSL
jgi:hypothetical protein